MTTPDSQPRYLICIANDGYEASLELRKVYLELDDPIAARQKHVRVVDESGEDYLFPSTYFVPIELPQAAVHAFASAM